MKHPPPQAFGPTANRISDVAAHVNRYSFKGVARLARDAGVSPSAVSRLVNGRMNPSFVMVARITEALERELGYRIDPRDLVAEAGPLYLRSRSGLPGVPPRRRDRRVRRHQEGVRRRDAGKVGHLPPPARL